MAIQKCAKGTCFSMTGAPQCAHRTADADTVVLRLLDDRDPDDAKQHTRDLTAEFWRDASDRARKAYQAAETDRRREVAINHVRAVLLDRAERAAGSYASGGFVPIVQWFRARGGLELPL